MKSKNRTIYKVYTASGYLLAQYWKREDAERFVRNNPQLVLEIRHE